MVTAVQFIAYLSFGVAACLAQGPATSKVVQEALFSLNGYPKPGDIPLLNRKIFRGARVSVLEHPYVASVRRRHAHYLTGALVTRNTVITVAHPLHNVPTYELGVVIGENYSDRGAALLTVLLVVLHQKFDPYSLASDLALVRVYEDMVVKVNQKIIPIAYDNIDSVPPGQTDSNIAFVTGWGRCDWSGKEFCLPRSSIYYPDEKVDPMLRTITFNLPRRTRNHYCVGYRHHGVFIQPGMLCTGTAREEEALAPCLAVPGAPLVLGGRLVGLQSWGFGCGYVHDLPLIYTQLSYYRGWIKHNLEVLSNIDVNDLKDLFLANRAFILQEWLLQTRSASPDYHDHSNHPLQMALIDKTLIMLKGNVTDLRDYVNHGAFRQEKFEMYDKIREHLARQRKIEDLAKHALRTGRPFLNQEMKDEVDFS